MKVIANVLVLSLALLCSNLNAQFFTGIGDLPGGGPASASQAVSGDGNVVFGRVDSAPSGSEVARWTLASNLEGLGYFEGLVSLDNNASDASLDGTYATGDITDVNAGGRRAFRWSETGGFQNLGTLSGGSFSAGFGISSDGSTVAGVATDSSGNEEAFRWTESEGMVGLGDLAGGASRSQARGVSGDGSIIVGLGTNADGNRAIRWTESTGMVNLGTLDGGTISFANSISSDGSAIVGISDSSTSPAEAFLWTESEGMIGLGHLPSSISISNAVDVSRNGLRVIGQSRFGNQDVAFLWDEDNGMQDLKTVLTNEYGLDLQGWRLTDALGISDDGRTIVGIGFNPGGVREGWVARINAIPEPGSALIISAFGVGYLIRRKR